MCQRWKFFKILVKKSGKVPPNLRCNYNMTTLLMCISANVLAPAPIDKRAPLLPPWEKAPPQLLKFISQMGEGCILWEVATEYLTEKRKLSAQLCTMKINTTFMFSLIQSVMLLLYLKCSFKNNMETFQWNNIFLLKLVFKNTEVSAVVTFFIYHKEDGF